MSGIVTKLLYPVLTIGTKLIFLVDDKDGLITNCKGFVSAAEVAMCNYIYFTYMSDIR